MEWNIKSKAEKAAIVLANKKTDKANAFYEYHKDIIDEYQKLQSEASEARNKVMMITIKRIERDETLPF